MQEALNTHDILYATGFDLCVLNTSYKGFGYKKQIHIWLTSDDYNNANLMILLGYIIMGHPEWKEGIIKIFAIYQPEEAHRRKEELQELIKEGRLPISLANINLISADTEKKTRDIIGQISVDSDLTFIGFRHEQLKTEGYHLFTGYETLGNVLFVSANKKKEIN